MKVRIFLRVHFPYICNMIKQMSKEKQIELKRIKNFNRKNKTIKISWVDKWSWKFTVPKEGLAYIEEIIDDLKINLENPK